MFGENNYPKIGEKEAFELYSDLITPNITELENMKGRGKNKRQHFRRFKKFRISFYWCLFALQRCAKDTVFERTIVEKIKLKRKRLDEIKRKKQNINNELFKEYFTNYQSPSNMYKKLIETKSTEINKTKVDIIKKILSKS